MNLKKYVVRLGKNISIIYVLINRKKDQGSCLIYIEDTNSNIDCTPETQHF